MDGWVDTIFKCELEFTKKLKLWAVIEGTIRYFPGLMGERIFQTLEEMNKDDVASEKGHLSTWLSVTGFSLMGDINFIL